MGVLATVFGGVTLLGSGGQAKKTQGPPINASSSDEENYIKYVCFVDRTTKFIFCENLASASDNV